MEQTCQMRAVPRTAVSRYWLLIAVGWHAVRPPQSGAAGVLAGVAAVRGPAHRCGPGTSHLTSHRLCGIDVLTERVSWGAEGRSLYKAVLCPVPY
jgi:hypothetical protein